jgi:DNA-binding transcriptional regulator LsrR (DeoR family)
MAVTWGSTVSHLVDGLSHLIRSNPVTHRLRVVPVCGEPLGRASERDTSSRLAKRLHELANGDKDQPLPSLTGVPALISRSFRGAHLDGIWKFVRRSASYSEIFGSRKPLINQVDSLLTAVGTARQPMGFMHAELLKAGSRPRKELTSAALAKLVVGDIGGVLLPRPGLGAAGRAEVEALNAMWTGANLSHLKRIAQQASRSTRPGVIVATMGEDRAESLAQAIRDGLVNELIVDRPLASALARALKE